MLSIAKAVIEKNVLAQDKIGIAVSGGSDSMCLLHLVLSLKRIERKNIIVINLDHSIREHESERDSSFVREFCETEGLKLRFKKVNIPELAAARGIGEEVCARGERRSFFNEVLEKEGLKMVLLAHHKRDQAETILQHMFRGCGIKGLIGMSERSEIYLRPLINVDKDVIQEYLKQNNIQFVEDSTNLFSDYSRNYIRNEILPIIKKRFPFAEESISSLSSLASLDEEFILSRVDRKKLRAVSSNTISVDISALSSFSLGARYISEALKFLGEEADVERKHIELIIELAKAQNGNRISIKKNLVAIKEYRVITFIASENANGNEHLTAELPFKSILNNRYTDFCGYRIFLTSAGKLVQESQNDFFTGSAARSRKLYFDANKVGNDAVIRFRREGDVFTPYLGKQKKLKKYLIDKKIPLRIRDKMPLLCYNDKTLIIFGEEINDSVKVDKSTNTAESIMCVWLEKI